MTHAIKITDYVYSCGIVCFAEMQDGDSWYWTSDAISKSYGCYMLSGSLTMSRSLDSTFPAYVCGVNGEFIKGDVLDDTLVANGYTSWICISKLPDKPERNITLQQVDGTFMLPLGVGVIVLEGSVVINNITVDQCKYFRPRDANLEITGKATLALII